MSCLYPNRLIVHGLGSTKKVDGSPGHKVDFLGNKYRNDEARGSSLQRSDRVYITQEGVSEIIDVPCGQCAECRIQKARVWANRIVCEQSLYPPEQCWFVTLTYDDKHLPPGKYALPTLVKKDVSTFMKDLRSKLDYTYSKQGKVVPRIRFFAAGEYGSLTARPHYHLIIFGYDFSSEILYEEDNKELAIVSGLSHPRKSGSGSYIWSSNIISQCWDKGFNAVSPSNWQTAFYTARYTLKKMTGKMSHVYDDLGIEPEFSLMSRMPGIAHDWYIKNLDELEETFGYHLPVQGTYEIIDRYGENILFGDNAVVQSSIKRFKTATAEDNALDLARRTDLDLEHFNFNLSDTNRGKYQKIYSGI